MFDELNLPLESMSEDAALMLSGEHMVLLQCTLCNQQRVSLESGSLGVSPNWSRLQIIQLALSLCPPARGQIRNSAFH